jgi:ketosteroid isomerase-like protein
MTDPVFMIDRLAEATNRHDLDAMELCFAPEYRCSMPAHPSRDFRGSAQMRRNWEQIFMFVPDLRADLRRTAANGDTVWSEWEFRGTRRDGTPHHMTGCVIFGVSHGVAEWGRFFMEPVERAGKPLTKPSASRWCDDDSHRRRHRSYGACPRLALARAR